MVITGIFIEPFQIGTQKCCLKFSFLMGKCKHLVSRILDRSRFMSVDMSGPDRNNPFVTLEHAVDHDLIRLCPAYQEVNLRLGTSARRADLVLCPVTVAVNTITGLLLPVRLYQALHDLLMRPFRIITFKR